MIDLNIKSKALDQISQVLHEYSHCYDKRQKINKNLLQCFP